MVIVKLFYSCTV